MPSLTLAGLPVVIIDVGFVVVASGPVWLAARVTGARQPTFARAAISLFVGTILTVVSLFAFGGYGLLIAPLGFLIAFKFLLDTSIFGAVMLSILALIGYALMIHFIGGSADLS